MRLGRAKVKYQTRSEKRRQFIFSWSLMTPTGFLVAVALYRACRNEGGITIMVQVQKKRKKGTGSRKYTQHVQT